MDSVRARSLAVPAGMMPSGSPLSITAGAADEIDPSPPHTTMISAD
jgi:hypothetical protein